MVTRRQVSEWFIAIVLIIMFVIALITSAINIFETTICELPVGTKVEVMDGIEGVITNNHERYIIYYPDKNGVIHRIDLSEKQLKVMNGN